MKGLIDIKPVVLEGKRIRLEPLTLEHHSELCSIGLDPELWTWTITLIRSPEEMRSYIKDALRLRDEGYAVPFVIRDTRSHRLVGCTRYGNIDRASRRVEIGWTWIARENQRSHANTEAKYLLLRHAFDDLGCNRVEFKTDLLNEASRRALVRIGAVEEGVLRKHVVTANGRIRDTVYYSIIAEEWPAAKVRLGKLVDRPFEP